MANPPTAVSPPEDVLVAAVTDLRTKHPSLGLTKTLTQLKTDHPEWTVSEKRLRKVIQSTPKANGANDEPREVGLIADTGLDPSIDVTNVAPKVKVKLFGGEKGKGLVAKEKMFRGEVLWQEEPWIITADS